MVVLCCDESTIGVDLHEDVITFSRFRVSCFVMLHDMIMSDKSIETTSHDKSL